MSYSSYNGQTINYDDSGNPTSYKGDTITWNGRLMTSYTKGNRRYEYSYNSDGMRTVKKIYENNELIYTYIYIWDGDVLLASRISTADSEEPTYVRYLYDDSGELYGMDYNGAGFFGFIKNLQGDIVSIVPLDSQSDGEVNIEYDAWGKPIFGQASSGSEALIMAMIMAATNVAYRSYFYDFDTELYYLRSRYYDPEVGRFINADDTQQLKIPSDLSCGLSNDVLIINLFAYCGNNPIMRKDPDGRMSIPALMQVLSNLIGIMNILSVIDSFGEADAYCINKYNYNGDVLGHLKVKFEASYKKYKLFEFLNYWSSIIPLLFSRITQNLLYDFKNLYGREFLFSNECVMKEIYDHFVGYMWSIGVRGYQLPAYMQAYGAYCVLHGAGYRNSIYNACVDADIYEKDVYASEWTAKAESKAFDYFNGINTVYISTEKDPYFYPKNNKRKNKYNPEWNKSFFIL